MAAIVLEAEERSRHSSTWRSSADDGARGPFLKLYNFLMLSHHITCAPKERLVPTDHDIRKYSASHLAQLLA